ncbi:MAG: SMP-30/gluconolactonase/LRE family protein, partial [candidate division KSB1 bacterium]|nr:SMP-30/gluconolactonase/LRE family protein [candidate division KSB1 bacterium]
MQIPIKRKIEAVAKGKLTVLALTFIVFTGCAKTSERASSEIGNSKISASQNTAWEKVMDGLNFPEGPAWDGDKTLYCSNCYGGWITRLMNGKADTFLTARQSPFTFEKTNGLTFYDGSLYACDFGIGAILKISHDGKTEIYANGFNGKPFNRPNDLTFDAAGNLYFTDPKSYSREVLDGRVFRAKDGTTEMLADSLGFPNGIALSADGQMLYVCESVFSRILRFTIMPDGQLKNREIFAELPGGDPDGIDFDNQGNLYVAHFGGGAVYVIAPNGNIKQKIQTPGKKPTNIEFGGDDLKTLFLTEVETNALYKRHVDIAGAKIKT